MTLNLSYPAAALDPAQVTFNFRETWVTASGMTWDSPSTPVPAASWSFVNEKQITLTPPAGADAGAIYSFVYPAKDPVVLGIGFAAIRDLVTFLRRDASDAQKNDNPLNDLKQAPCALQSGCSSKPDTNFDIAIMEGISQSGRLARDFLWRGFNDDQRGNPVFDAMYPIIAGSRKTYTNFRFGQPGRWSKQHEDHWQPGDQFPFAYNVIQDPVSGATDGLFARCQASAGGCPKVMHLDGGYEFWGARAALVSTDGAGHDLTLPDNVRLYLVPGASHGGGAGAGSPGSATACQFPTSAVAEKPVLRALVPALVAWVAAGTPPPPQQWPSISAGTLAPPGNRAQVGFPDLSAAGVTYSGTYNQLFVTDYSRAIPAADLTKGYDVRVPTVDSDGNEKAGVRVPDVTVPIATYLSWNPRKPGYAPGDVCAAAGSTIRLAATLAARQASGDPRPSIAERYPGGKADYVAKVTAAAQSLTSSGLVLADDVALYVTAAQSQTVVP